jgi:uncharacterized protein YhaN
MMPTRSRNERTKARQKRTNSLLKRALKQSAFEANKNFGAVMILLEAAGGEVIVPDDVVRGVIPQLQTSRWQTEQIEGAVKFTLVKTVKAEDLPAESLDEMKARMQAAHNTDEVPTYVPPANSLTAQLASDPTPVDPTDAAGDPA